MQDTTRLDKPVFFISLGCLVIVTALLTLKPESSLEQLKTIHHFMTHDLGWMFLGSVFVGILWLGWLAFGKHGDIVLGTQYDGPVYSNISWFGMLFCAGIGSNLLYFGTTEWIGYYLTPPPISGVAAGTPEALDWAGSYSFFHWGISAWATYAIATLPIAYILHIKKSSTLRVSTACEGVLGSHSKGPLGKFIDVLFIFGLVGGVGTSLGVGIPMISAVASDLFGVSRGMGLDVGILIGLTAMFSLSVSAGLDKGIKLLSDINVGLAIALLSLILCVGPTSFIINQAFDSLSLMLQNFIEMSLRTDSGNDVSFAQDNTIFFWAWWMSWAPFMGVFVARISGGRTIRQLILGVVGGGSIGCWVGFSILGHTTMNLAETGSPRLTAILNTAREGGGVDAPLVVVDLLQSLPAPTLITGIFFVLSFIFVATSLDSAAFTLAATASDDLPVEGQPPRWHRLVWAFVLAGTALTLMYIGGLQVLQAASVVVGLPVLGIMGLMVWSFMRGIDKQDA